MPTNPNMVAIQTVTVGSGGAANIEFTSIPQTYTDLYVVTSLRVSSTDITSLVYFNNSTSSYTRRVLYGDGSSATSASASDAGVLWTNTSSNTASTFGSATIYVPNYTGSNNKSASVDFVTENNATTAYAAINAFLWSNSSAITSIKLVPNSGTYVQYSTATLYGVTSAGYGAKATGGIITSDANYYYHTFLASDTFTPTSNITADYLVVAGGAGGGGFYTGAGGGAGGLRSTVTATGGGGSLESAVSLTSSTAYTITVGAGGAGGLNDFQGTNGSDSSVSGSGLTTITSTGGGGGGSAGGGVSARYAGKNGGSGGGSYNGATVGTGTTNQGYAGGLGNGGYAGGGGGGAGAAGSAGANGSTSSSSTTGGNGGNGVAVAITGTSVYYAGGGGGSAQASGGTQGTGGLGGGANGSYNTKINATANTGGGGGASAINPGGDGSSGNGGSGIIVIRYAK